MQVSKNQITEIATKVVSNLKNASTLEGDFSKIFISKNGFDWAVLSGGSTLTNTDGTKLEFVASVKHIHPIYEGSEKAMQECDIEVTPQSLSDWDWENFTAGADFENAVQNLIEKIEERLAELEVEISE